MKVEPMTESRNFQNSSSAFSTMKSSTILGMTVDVFFLPTLIFQFILVITARSRRHQYLLVWPIVWLAYVLKADFAEYAMGLVPKDTVQGGRKGELRIFWAPFLILHLGGPNSITCLTLSDNELWLRYATRLISLSYSFGRVFLRTFLKNDLWIPTAIMFVAGVLRYIEKVICRFLARMTKYRESTLPEPDPGVNYAKLMQTRNSFLQSNIPAEFQMSLSELETRRPEDNVCGVENSGERLSQVEIVKKAYSFFQDFRGLFVNSVFSYDLREDSRRYFLSLGAEDAFNICEVELNFAYDVFYTKLILIDRSYLRWLNLVSLIFQLVSTVLWFQMDKTSFHPSSVQVTNALVYGSISLDLFSSFTLTVSDWGIAWVKDKHVVDCIEKWLLLKKRARERQRKLWRQWFVFKHLRVFFRWSECISQADLIKICIGERFMRRSRYRTRREIHGISLYFFTDELRDFLFKQMVIRSVGAKDEKHVKELSSSRGMWILTEICKENPGLELSTTLSPWVSDVNYEESLILWHIATTLCYCTSPDEEVGNDLREFSKVLSDYMLNILTSLRRGINHPSSTILGRMILVDTSADAIQFLVRKLPCGSKAKKKDLLQQACEKILQVNTDVIEPKDIKGDKRMSVLFDGCLLAKQLQRLERYKWEVMSKVWAELLFYCATHSRASGHLVMLSWGGELLTLVWLLMAHLGLGNHYRYKKETTAQLVIGNHSA